MLFAIYFFLYNNDNIMWFIDDRWAITAQILYQDIDRY